MVVRHGDKQQKLQVEKLTSDFRNVVEAYSTSQQVCSICAAHFLRFFLFRSVWLSRLSGALILCLWLTNDITLQQIAAKMKGILLVNASQADDINNDEHSTSDTDLLFHQKQKSLQQNLQFEQAMLQEREQRVRQIEDDVLDVNQIMRDLGTLITLQGENIGEQTSLFFFSFFALTLDTHLLLLPSISDTIEGSIDHAASNVEAGTSELLKAAEYQAKYRRKVIILLIVAVIIGLIVTGLVVSQLKS